MKKVRSIANNILGISALIFTAVFLILSERASVCALGGLKLCAYKLIPTLFPLMCLNSILTECGTVEASARLIGRPISRLFGVRDEYSVPILMSILGSAPAGAACLRKLSQSRVREEASLPLLLASSASIGFTAVFLSELTGDKKRGLAIFCIQLFALTVSALILRDKGGRIIRYPQREIEKKRLSEILSCALTDSVNAMTTVCGSVVFFSALSGVAVSLPIPSFFKCFLCAFLEITSGATYIASNLPRDSAFIWLCAATGWSGASIHCQVMSLKGDIPCGKYFLGKILTALVSAAAAILMTQAGLI